jgi:uncharacterized protein (TIGR03437 family)
VLALLASAKAQPVVNGVANVASFALSGLPHAGIAQGSIFTVFGDRMGPSSLQLAASFPLPRELGGTSMRVTVGGTAVNPIMVFTSAAQAAAILPSNTPVGDGTLTVTYQNQTSAAFPLRVVRSSFGIFALNQAGSGPAIVTDPNFVPNTMTRASNPGDVMILWGTGLGPVSGDEAAGPLPGEQDVDVRVFVGGRRADVTYRGRSGCCAGLDQIVFTVPPGPEGCAVPLVVVAGGVSSNFTSLSIAAGGRTCSDRGGLSAEQLDRAAASGALRAGVVRLFRAGSILGGPPPLPFVTVWTDQVAAAFSRYSFAGLLASQALTILPAGTCTVRQFRGEQVNVSDPAPREGLDAGPMLNLTGPRGARQVARQAAGGVYTAHLGGGGQEIPGLNAGLDPDYLERGAYSINNGSGTAAVGAFTARLTIGEEVNWTNRASVRTITRTAPLTVNWTGGDPAAEFVDITGSVVVVSRKVGATFTCRAPRSAGSFTIPAEVLSSLPASEMQEGLPTGYLAVDAAYLPVTFSAAGLEAGFFSYLRTASLPVTYR